MREFHRIAIANNSVPIFVLNHTIGEVDGKQGNGKSYNENVKPYNEMIRKIATELDSMLIDLPLQMSVRNIDVADFVSGDQIHLSLAANHYYTDMIFSGLNDIKLN